ncbi:MULTISPECIES: hypothetical protein [Pontibacillus]|uniref:Inner spore coat protein n=1 Tax=Pontibacillus chungwhensis TaxID=265426 RepID=A0ABY8V0J1_9BACI|nr:MULTISPECIES: hypothetical protein [Pontibacillus]MCD5325141.1 hypothetical protein [Pontibacillus sp. HN14]WIF97391.1 hypothetical protein QNI29_16890 [Pontibacillus chungwhensis]
MYYYPVWIPCAPQAYGPYPMPPSRPSYPEVDPSTLTDSAKAFQSLMSDAHIIIEKFATSPSFSQQVMEAAQQSNKEKVKQLLEGTGIKHPIKIRYNPDGLHLTLTAQSQNQDCCKMELAFHW